MTDHATSNAKAAARTIISIDTMGGDQGPAAVVAGISRSARKIPNINFILHGPKDKLEPLIEKRGIEDRCTIRHTEGVVSMTDKPSYIMRHGNGTSMWSAIESVRSGEADVCVSAGNTGALMAVAMIRLRKLEGVNRPAIAVLWPSKNRGGFNVMLDVGADIKADEEDLLQYALMGASYARNGLELEHPRIGLLNVGTEENKGNPELKVAHQLLQAAAKPANFDYVGFVEGGDIPSNRVDVIVTDGFTGNVALKTAEGTASFVGSALRKAFEATPLSRLAAVLAMTSLRRLRKRIDPRRVNGGVFLGLNGTVVKSHGSADAKGTEAAINLAVKLATSKFKEKLAARVASSTAIQQDVLDGYNENGLEE